MLKSNKRSWTISRATRQLTGQLGKLVGITVDRPTPAGGTITGGAEPAQVTGTFLYGQKNFTTGESGIAADKAWQLGGAFIGGLSLSFDPKVFNAIVAQNAACRKLLAKHD
jgi:hypothetical protein